MNRIFISFVFSMLLLASCGRINSIQQLPSCYLECDSFKVHYKTYGQGNSTLVFIHGFGCNIESWREQFSFFAERGHSMLFIDLPGYGKSDKPYTEYTLDFFAYTIKTVLDSLHITTPVLIGHSLGAPICRQVVRNYPELNAALCKVDEVACRFPEDSVAKRKYIDELANFANAFKGPEYEKNIQEFIASLFLSDSPKAVADYAFGTMSGTPEYIAYSTMLNLVKEIYWDETPASVPSLIVCAKDFIAWPDNEVYMTGLLPKLEYKEMEDVSHFLMMEKPDEFNRILLDFVNNLSN